MKQKKTLQLIFLQFLAIISFTSPIFATEISCTLYKDTVKIDNQIDVRKENSLSFGLVFFHFNPTKKSQDAGFQTNLFDPGIEILLTAGMTNKLDISTGLHYQYGLIKNSSIGERSIFGELSIPIIASVPIINSDKRGINFSSGVYFGQYIHIKKESKSGKLNPGNTWQKISFENIEGYSKDKNITDVYIGLGYQELNRLFQIDIFSRYRLNEIWLNNQVSKLIFGLKINYKFKI